MTSFREKFYKLRGIGLLGILVFVSLSGQINVRSPVGATASLPLKTILFEDDFNYPDGLLTNEYNYYNPNDPQSVHSETWTMTSGSIFAQDQSAWTGVLGSCSPNPTSSNCTNSNVFRLISKEIFAGNVNISFSFRQNGNMGTSQSWYGTHIFVRYLSPYDLYYASVNRADKRIVIKRKVPCGPSNQGTYFELSSYVPHSWESGVWNEYMVSVKTEPSGNVWLGIYDISQNPPELLVSGIDKGGINPNWTSDCQTEGKYPSNYYPPITDPGKVGVRGDFSDFSFDDFQVFFEVTDIIIYLPLIIKG